MELDQSDINTLMEAVTAWETKDVTDEMMCDMIGTMLTEKGPERDEFKQRQIEHKEKMKEKRRIVSERAVVLKAKLLRMRDSLSAAKLLETARIPTASKPSIA